MRPLSAFLTAAIMMLGLVGAFALGGEAAGAQEETTQQTFESREITNSSATAAASTTPSPSPEPSDGDPRAGTECQGAEVLDTVGPTDEDLILGPFDITGESFRLTYETTDADASGFPFVDVTVLDEANNEVGGRVIFEEGKEQEIVGGGPGSFTLEARAEDLQYTITVEDCTGGDEPGPPTPPPDDSGGDDGPGNDGQPVPRNPVPEDRFRTDVDPENDVIHNTVSDEPLPNTGGVPLLGLGFFAFICVFAAFALLRPVIRRDSRP